MMNIVFSNGNIFSISSLKKKSMQLLRTGGKMRSARYSVWQGNAPDAAFQGLIRSSPCILVNG